MDHDHDHELELLRARVAALESERLPGVDRASRRRDRRQVLGGIGLFAIAMVMGSVVSVSALAGVNTVFSDDIVDGEVRHIDIRENTIGSSRMLDNSVHSVKISDGSITGVDIADDALSVVVVQTTTDNVAPLAYANAFCPEGYFATGGGDPFESTTEQGAVKANGVYALTGETPVGWAVRNTGINATNLTSQVICIRL